ncbi:uncharacterized protein LOC107274606 isoform X1 [Cephus cinctus]|uniref:Uncharacterized protein LOC107274606 isoform X1 n=1 Tax=Cephus cinctus TaxID=211228 RepID=A0AAJ7FUT1_CEPCN|nr:uncharacterized protein LOC107274606 isoform X1 [Cephus cinctus]
MLTTIFLNNDRKHFHDKENRLSRHSYACASSECILILDAAVTDASPRDPHKYLSSIPTIRTNQPEAEKDSALLTMAADDAIVIRNARKSYGKGVQILDDLNMIVKRGSM